ncbi:MAG TPA: tRNA (adenosine(37)-N6)-threonylcarbamoyltransferase complex ATPase subunit type 1 TsaE [Chryseolinea sp.]|nr:tRNA (adenosine(37)-N6)-threonylcarbamoyltransferase complex ATPase subunit type 1 TsaE [Chryseolinea sp.]HPH46214.1 tRNA (adenosine(37)-N6)-threonylcarbamoyltransferase complex ATPase subunit type 1 TsaE [Chryseolinea sp.]
MLDDLPRIAKALAKFVDQYKVWLFHGEMGAGKTTLIKEVCQAVGVVDSMSSPTFSIVNEYETKDHRKVFHFDFYRLKNEAEAVDIGTEEYFYSGHPCFIEWAEKIPSLIPLTHAEVSIQVEDDTHRTIVLSVHDGEKKIRL